MTVESINQNNIIQYQGNGQATEFSFPFKVDSKDELLVIITNNGADTIITNFTLNGVDSFGNLEEGQGVVVLNESLETGSTITITTQLEFNQSSTYRNREGLDLNSIENSLDRLTNQNRQLNRAGNNSIKFRDSANVQGAVIDGSPVAGRFLRIKDTQGNLEIVESLSGEVIPSSFVSPLLQLTSQEEFRNAIDSQENIIEEQGDLVVGDSNGNASRLEKGGSNEILYSDGNSAVWGFQIENNLNDNSSSKIATQQAIRSYVNAVSIAKIIEFSRLDTSTISYNAGTTIINGNRYSVSAGSLDASVDGNWDTGTASLTINSVRYVHWFLLADGTVEPKFSSSSGSPTLPSGAFSSRAIGFFVNSSGDIVGFRQIGTYFRVGSDTFALVSSETMVSAERSIPIVANSKADLDIVLVHNGFTSTSHLYSGDLEGVNAPAEEGSRFTIRVNSSVVRTAVTKSISSSNGSIKYRGSGNGNSRLYIRLSGWEDLNIKY